MRSGPSWAPLFVCITLLAPPCLAQTTRAKDTLVVWGNPELSRSGATAPGRFSWTPAPADGDAGSLLFDSTGVNLQGSDPLSAIHATSFRIPVQFRTTRRTLVVKHDLRMFVQKDRTSRMRVILDIGGRTSIIDFPRGTAANGDTTFSVYRVLRIPASAMVFSLIIVAERDSQESPAILNIDSDDIIIRRE